MVFTAAVSCTEENLKQMRSEVEKIRRRSCPEKFGSGTRDSWCPRWVRYANRKESRWLHHARASSLAELCGCGAESAFVCRSLQDPVRRQGQRYWLMRRQVPWAVL